MSNEVVNYVPAKPRLRTIYKITVASVWAAVIIGLSIFVFLWYSSPNSWATTPNFLQPKIQLIRTFIFIFAGAALVWFFGMIWAVAKHNQKFLDAWLQEKYGIHLPKKLLFFLSIEIWTNRKKHDHYQSLTIPLHSAHEVVNVSVVSNGEDILLMNMDTMKPFPTNENYYKDYYASRFRKNVWLNKGEIIYATSTLTFDDKVHLLVWSKSELFEAWFNQIVKDKSDQEEEILDGIMVAEDYTPIQELETSIMQERASENVIYVIDWLNDEDMGYPLTPEEFRTLVTTDKPV